MAAISQAMLSKVSKVSHLLLKEFHLSSAICINLRWREENKLSRNPNSFGPLTNLPDYSFKDGRPVPYGTNQKRRIDEQRANLLKIQELAGEIDDAVRKHALLQKEKEENKRKILDRKLKEKGTKVLTSGTAVK